MTSHLIRWQKMLPKCVMPLPGSGQDALEGQLHEKKKWVDTPYRFAQPLQAR
jgi:hypothetical protein